jgi:hypothetical protein
MKRRFVTLVSVVAACVATLALPAAAQAHCPQPKGWGSTIGVDGSANPNWSVGYAYPSGAHAWFAKNQSVYALPDNGTWDWVYGTSWILGARGWYQHTGWHWLSYTNVECGGD